MPAGPTQFSETCQTDELTVEDTRPSDSAHVRGLLKDREAAQSGLQAGGLEEWLVSSGGTGAGVPGKKAAALSSHPRCLFWGQELNVLGEPFCHVQPSSPGAELSLPPLGEPVRPLLGCQEEAPWGLEGPARAAEAECSILEEAGVCAPSPAPAAHVLTRGGR